VGSTVKQVKFIGQLVNVANVPEMVPPKDVVGSTSIKMKIARIKDVGFLCNFRLNAIKCQMFNFFIVV
jgi:hypothetical protein